MPSNPALQGGSSLSISPHGPGDRVRVKGLHTCLILPPNARFVPWVPLFSPSEPPSNAGDPAGSGSVGAAFFGLPFLAAQER